MSAANIQITYSPTPVQQAQTKLAQAESILGANHLFEKDIEMARVLRVQAEALLASTTPTSPAVTCETQAHDWGYGGIYFGTLHQRCRRCGLEHRSPA